MPKVLPYVYRLYNHVTGEFYIGYREQNKVQSANDIGYVYFTSSKYVKPRFSEFDISIIAEFFSGLDAYEFEQELIYQNWNNPLLLNKSCYHGKQKFRSNGPQSDEHKAKHSKSKKGIKRGPMSEQRKQAISLARRSITGKSKGTTGMKLGAQSIQQKEAQSKRKMGFVSAYDLTENKFTSVLKDEFVKFKGIRYVGLRSKLIP